MRLTVLFTLIVFVQMLLPQGLFAQEFYEYEDKVNMLRSDLISDADNARIDQAQEKIAQGDGILSNVQKSEERIETLTTIVETKRGREKRRARRERRRLLRDLPDERDKAAGLHSQGYEQLYTIYKNNFEQLDFDESSEERQAQQLMDEAASNFTSAKRMETSLQRSDPYEKLSSDFDRALQLRKDGIRMVIEAFWVYLEPEPEPEEEIVTQEDTMEMEDPVEITSDPDAGLVFRIQIIAVTEPLPQQEIEKLYYGEEEVTEKYHNSLYKYYVGRFGTYEEARSFNDSIGIYDAFVVAFQDGMRINIDEAIELSKSSY